MKGLPSRFKIVNGKFRLTSGKEKSQDGIWFYCTYDKSYTYTTDFGGDFLSLLQRPASFLLGYRTLLIGNLIKGVSKYVPNVTIHNVDIGYVGSLQERKRYSLMINYSLVEETKLKTQDVIFV